MASGSYPRLCQRTFWPRLDTIVWLDLPLRLCVLAAPPPAPGGAGRSRELLWGTNYERLWPYLLFWRKDSLLNWTVTQHVRKRNAMLAHQTDPRWSHIRFVRLTSTREVETFVAAIVERSAPARQQQDSR